MRNRCRTWLGCIHLRVVENGDVYQTTIDIFDLANLG